MSAGADVQQRDRDFGGFEALNLAAPTTPNSAARLTDIIGGAILNLSHEPTEAVTGLVETLVAEFNLDFSVLPAGAINVIATLSALASRTVAGANAVFILRIGGTIGAPDGAQVAIITATGALARFSNTGPAFAKPATAGGDLVKITAVADDVAGVGTIRGSAISFKGSP